MIDTAVYPIHITLKKISGYFPGEFPDADLINLLRKYFGFELSISCEIPEEANIDQAAEFLVELAKKYNLVMVGKSESLYYSLTAHPDDVPNDLVIKFFKENIINYSPEVYPPKEMYQPAPNLQVTHFIGALLCLSRKLEKHTFGIFDEIALSVRPEETVEDIYQRWKISLDSMAP